MLSGPVFHHFDAWTHLCSDVPPRSVRKERSKYHDFRPCQTLMLRCLPTQDEMRDLLKASVTSKTPVLFDLNIGHAMANPVDVMSKKDGRRIARDNHKTYQAQIVNWYRGGNLGPEGFSVQVKVGRNFRVWLFYNLKHTFPVIRSCDTVGKNGKIKDYLE